MKELRLINFLKITMLLWLVSTGTVSANENPLALFEKYIQLSNDFNPAVAELYSDQALVHASRVYPHGLERTMELTGVQWKKLLIQVMPLAKSQNDKSTFSNTQVIQLSGGFKIKADRYSVRKCYTDTGYYMILKPSGNGSLEIIEEYLETIPQSNC